MAEPWSGEERLFWLFYLIRKVAFGCKRSIAGTYPFYPNFFIITSTSWKIRAKNPNIREVDYGNTTCYSGKAVRDLDCDYSGMQEQRYENKGLACVISDSTYVKDKPAGCILDYNPAAGQKVKEGRIIYLTINAINIPLQAVPDVADNSSLRQAEARILASGFKLNDIEYMAGEKDWVYGVKYQDRVLAMGEKVPMGATLTLMVGNGGEEMQEGDSLSADEGAEPREVVTSESSAADESWF
mgnify:CR=1 FL=1